MKRYHVQKQVILLLSQNPLLVHNACKADTDILLVSRILFFLEKSSRVTAFLISKGTEFQIWGPKYQIEFLP